MARAHNPFRGGAAIRWSKNPPEKRIWEQVRKGHGDQCWVWTGRKNFAGYGQMIIQGRWWVVHRYVWTMFKGQIPAGLFVCHRCDNPSCVNPSHLWLGTNHDNILDSIAKGRWLKGERTSQAKLRNGDIKSIRSMYRNGALQAKIAAKYGIHHAHVSRIVNRKIWKHIR